MAPRAPLCSILVGVDGSPGAANALAWAISRAAEADARLLVVHVLTYSTEFRRDASLDTITTWRRYLRRQLRDEWAAPAVAAGIIVACELEEADTAAAGLLAVAQREAADLIVLGAHGRGSFADRLLGATTTRCRMWPDCPSSSCPSTGARHPPPERRRAEVKLRGQRAHRTPRPPRSSASTARSSLAKRVALGARPWRSALREHRDGVHEHRGPASVGESGHAPGPLRQRECHVEVGHDHRKAILS